MLGENILLTRFEYQRFNWTTKVDTIHIVYILVITRLHLHTPYLKESQEFVFFGNERCKTQYRFYHNVLVEINVAH